MPRLPLLSLLFVLASSATALHAQQNSRMDEFDWQDGYTNANLDTRPTTPWVADMTRSSQFPITVRLQQESLQYHWFSNTFIGEGKAHIFNPVAENVSFTYHCGVSFDGSRPTEFYARWTDHGRRLQIRLRKPGTDRTTNCSLKTVPAPAQQASAKP